jgi:hypothetical protein
VRVEDDVLRFYLIEWQRLLFEAMHASDLTQ